MSTISNTSTYTTADVAKVVDRMAADLHMIAQATGLMTRDHVNRVSADVKLMAQRGYVDRVDVVLSDTAGDVVKAAEYKASTDASGWSSDRPGNNLWPKTPGGDLNVVVFRTEAWWALTDTQRQAFIANHCEISWVTSDIDTSYTGLTGRYDRRYASNAFGLRRTVYEGN